MPSIEPSSASLAHPSDDPRVQRLDLRDLPPPEPLRRALDVLEAGLAPDAVLDVRTPCMPWPLLAQLPALGLRFTTMQHSDGSACVRIIGGDGRAGA